MDKISKKIIVIGNGLYRLAYRGGNWNNTSNAGVFYSNGINPRSNSNNNIGFRPALLLFPDIQWLRLLDQCKEIKGAYFHSWLKIKKNIILQER